LTDRPEKKSNAQETANNGHQHQQEGKTKIFCFKCGEMGHYSTVCQQNPDTNPGFRLGRSRLHNTAP
jgi:hypothetical protein